MNKQEKRWQWWMDVMARTCHQKSERSFFYQGWQFPVCARCSGMYLGYAIGIILVLFHQLMPWWLSACLLFVMWLDWWIQYKQIKASTNVRRCLTGFGAGIAIIHLLVSAIALIC